MSDDADRMMLAMQEIEVRRYKNSLRYRSNLTSGYLFGLIFWGFFTVLTGSGWIGLVMASIFPVIAHWSARRKIARIRAPI